LCEPEINLALRRDYIYPC